MNDQLIIQGFEKQLSKGEAPLYPNKWRQPPARKSSEYLDAYKSWVYLCVRKNSQAFSDLELNLYRGNKQDPEEIESHPALDLLYYVNEFMDHNILLQLTQTYFELTGENYWYIEPKSNGEPTIIIPLRPDLMTVLPSKSGDKLIGGYTYMVNGGEEIRFEPEEIIRMVYPNPKNIYRGIGVVEAAALAIDTDEFAATYNRNFFYNSAIPKGVFTTETKLTKTTRARLENSINEKHQGIKKSHKPMLLEGGITWQEMGTSQKDMEFLNQRKFSRSEIFSMFDIPEDLINTENSNRASVSEAINIYMKFGIKPRMKAFVSMLNEFYLPLFGNDLFFDFVDPSPLDIDQNVQIANTVPMTDNEKRGLFGLPDIGPDGDIIRMPNQTPSTEPVQLSYKRGKELNYQARPATQLEANTSELLKEAKNDIRDLYELKNRKKQLVFSKSSLELATDDEIYKFSPKQKDIVWKLFDVGAEKTEKQYWRKYRKYLRGQRDRVISRLQSRKAIKQVSDIGFNLPAEKAVFVAAFRDFVTKTINVTGNRTLSFVGVGNRQFDIEASAVQRFINKSAFEYVNDINRTTRDRLQKALEEQIAEGSSIPEISTIIENVYEEIQEGHAVTIARTETIKLLNWATEQGYDQSGVVRGKEWLSSRDNRVRHTHAPGTGVDGEIKRLGERFSNGVITPGYGGPSEEVVNCRCTIIPVLASFKSELVEPIQIEDKEEKENARKQRAEDMQKQLEDKMNKNIEEAVAKAVKLEVSKTVSEELRELHNDVKEGLNAIA